MSQKALDAVLARHPDAILDSGSHCGDEMAVVRKEQLIKVMAYLRDDAGLAFDMLTDLTVVDYLGQTPRFEVVYQLYSLLHRHRLRIKAPVNDASEEECWIHSCTGLWKAANWAEREAWDMYGIVFKGHPDLRRILMYEEFRGHPLRKDYAVNARQPLIRRPDATPTDDQTTRLAEHSHDRRVR
jgi:NADH-quinone oxidoreductase subunit C